MPSEIRQQILTQAARRRGIPYLMPPDVTGVTSLDCSLFVVLTFQDVGLTIPGGARTAEQIRQACDPIDLSDVQPGDLLFFEHTYNPGLRPAPDGHLATHVGIALDADRHRMWDCHASNENTNLPGVGETDISTTWWAPKLFEARRAPGLTGHHDSDPRPDTSSPQYRVTTVGLRLRRKPGTRTKILIEDLGEGTIVTAVDDEVAEKNDVTWRHVSTEDGTVGWAAAEYLERIGADPIVPPPPRAHRYRVTSNALWVRDNPRLDSETLVALPRDAIVTEVDAATVEADEIVWRHVQTEDGTVGWMSSGFLAPVPDE